MLRKQRLAAALAILCMLFALLSACRSSPVLMETLYQQQAPETDEEQEMLQPDDEGQEDSQFEQEQRDDAIEERDAEANRGISDENDTGTAEEAAEVQQNDTQNLQNYNLETAVPQPSVSPEISPSPAAAVSPSPSVSDSASPEPQPTVAPSAEPAVTTSTEPSAVPSAEPSVEPVPEASADPAASPEAEPSTEPSPEPSPVISETPDPRTRQITDSEGNVLSNVPENVSKVTAVGAAAQLVEIAGQDGTLLGSNSDLLSSGLAQAAFSDGSSIQSWWSGDGSGAPDDESFSALLTAAPEVCFVTSGQYTFTDDQLSQLEAQKIAVVTLNAFTSFDSLKENMRIIGQVLTRDSNAAAGAYDASGIAEHYCSWVDDILSQTQELSKTYGGQTYTMENSSGEYEVTGTVNTLYIAGWDYDAVYEIGGTAGSLLQNLVSGYGSGLAYAYSPLHKQCISAAMTAAGLNNESTRIRNQYKDGEYVYVTPMFHQFAPSVSGSRAAYYDGGGIVPVSADLFVSRMYDNSAYQLGVNTGVCQFPAIVVQSQDIADQLSNNWFWQFHGTNVYLEEGGQAYYCGICGEYQIYVNPQGMVSWAEGSAESPLESLWLACKFSGSSIDEAWSATADFYAEFFATTLDEGWRSAIFGE